MARAKGPKYELIVAAVGGDEMAIDEIVRHFEPMIDAQSGGDQEVREFIIAGLRTAIRHYDLHTSRRTGSIF